MEIHALDANTSKAAVDFATIDADGNPVGFKIEDGNCGVFVNGKWACFTGETLVHTETGTMPIQNIVAGQKVWSYDLSKGQKVLSSVAKTMTSAAKQLVRVFIGNDTIQATTEHPFYANRQWTAAKELRKGVSILLLSGMIGTVDSIAIIDTLVTTYNFEVANTHNYFVGVQGFLVHNACAKDIKDRFQTFFKKNESNLIECETFLNKMRDPDWSSFNNLGFAVNSSGELHILNTRNRAASWSPAKLHISECHGSIAAFFDIKPKEIAALSTAINSGAAGYKSLTFIKDGSIVIEILSENVGAKIHKRCRLPAIKTDIVEGVIVRTERMNFEIKEGDFGLPASYKTWAAWEIERLNNRPLKYLNIHLDIER
jgi:hypothetical protein